MQSFKLYEDYCAKESTRIFIKQSGRDNRRKWLATTDICNYIYIYTDVCVCVPKCRWCESNQ